MKYEEGQTHGPCGLFAGCPQRFQTNQKLFDHRAKPDEDNHFKWNYCSKAHLGCTKLTKTQILGTRSGMPLPRYILETTRTKVNLNSRHFLSSF